MSIPKIRVNLDSRVQTDVVRLIVTRNTDGDVVGESYAQIYGLHWADIQPLSDRERIANEQLNIKVTHKIYPEPRITAAIENDFFREVSNGKLYRIIESYDYKTLKYFKVWAGSFANPSANFVQEFKYTITGVGAGVHVFGAGLFSSVPVFTTTPTVYGTANNDCDFHIESISTTGFELVDDGGAEVPNVTIEVLGI